MHGAQLGKASITNLLRYCVEFKIKTCYYVVGGDFHDSMLQKEHND